MAGSSSGLVVPLLGFAVLLCRTIRKTQTSGDGMKTKLQSQATLVLPGAGERLSVIGDRQTIKLDGSHTKGAFALIEQNNQPGTAVPEHFHTQEDEIFYVLEGEME